MDDKEKTKEQLIDELNELRNQWSKLAKPSMEEDKLHQLAPDIVKNAFYAIWACRDSSNNHEILFWNKGAEILYDTPEEKALNLNFVQTFVNELEQRQSSIDIDDVIRNGKTFRNFLAQDHTLEGENRLVLVDNFRVWDELKHEYVQVEMSHGLTQEKFFETYDNLATIKSIELKRIEQLEREKELMGTVQKLVAEKQEITTRTNIAIDFVHNVNNLAGPIKTWVGLIKDRLFVSDPRDEQINEFLEKIERETDRLLDEAEHLRHTPGKLPIDLKQLVKPMESNLKIQFPEIDVRVHTTDNYFLVRASKSQLSVALWNIIFNAAESIIESGNGTSIEIGLQLNRLGDKEIVEVKIADDGPGIPANEQDSIFDLGYSKKLADKLSGYGLWRSKVIIDSLGGEISFTSELNKGTEFKISLPSA